MALIKILNFDLLPVNNSFFKESRKLNVEFELVLLQDETESNCVFEIEFSISSMINRGRVIRAMAGKKQVAINPNDQDFLSPGIYKLDEDGKIHLQMKFMSEDIPEYLLSVKNSHHAFSNLFITAELHNPMLQVLLGFAESAGKNFFLTTKAA